MKATVDEAVAPLRQQVASLLQLVAAQHAEMLKAVGTSSAAASSYGDAPPPEAAAAAAAAAPGAPPLDTAAAAAAAASSGDAPMAQPTAQPAAAGLLLTTSGRLNYGANPAPSPATPDDVQPNVGRATMPSLRATPVLDC